MCEQMKTHIDTGNYLLGCQYEVVECRILTGVIQLLRGSHRVWLLWSNSMHLLLLCGRDCGVTSV